MQIVLVVLAYIVLGYFAFMIVGGLLNGIWEIIRDQYRPTSLRSAQLTRHRTGYNLRYAK